MNASRRAALFGATLICCAALGRGRASAQSVTYEFSRTASDWSADSTSQAGGGGGTSTNGPIVGGPSAGGATASSGVTRQVDVNNWADSLNQLDVGPNPDGQSILQVGGLLMSQLETADNGTGKGMWATGVINSPAPAPNAADNAVTATLNTTPAQSSGTATLRIDLLWVIYHSNTNSWSITGFAVRIRDSNGNVVLSANTDRLEFGTVTVAGDDTLDDGPVSIDPEGDGLTLTTTMNVSDGDEFTIEVEPYTDWAQINASWGNSALVDISLAIDARVTVTQ